MTVTKTLTIIKPCAAGKNLIGPILAMINEAGFRITAIKMIHLTKEQAENFYSIHREKPFFKGLVSFMTSGKVVAAILEKENAVADYRKLMGATDPAKAEEGSIRKRYAESIERNAVHGSDSDENAELESNFFFSRCERFS
jgi:nucleoside-diphosphate kinase